MPVAHAIYCFGPFLFWNRLAVVKPRIHKYFHDLQADNTKSLPVGVAGYCWGGKYSFLLCSDSEKSASGKSLVDCGFTAHPSFLTIPNDAQGVKLPLSISVGDVDMALPLAKVHTIKEILEEKGKDKHEVVIIPGATHGFAIRADPRDEKAVEHGLLAEDQAANWFSKWFAKASQ